MAQQYPQPTRPGQPTPAATRRLGQVASSPPAPNFSHQPAPCPAPPTPRTRFKQLTSRREQHQLACEEAVVLAW